MFINYAKVDLITRALHSLVSEECLSQIENYFKIIANMIFIVKIRTEKPVDTSMFYSAFLLLSIPYCNWLKYKIRKKEPIKIIIVSRKVVILILLFGILIFYQITSPGSGAYVTLIISPLYNFFWSTFSIILLNHYKYFYKLVY